MSIVLDGSGGITSTGGISSDGGIDAADLTGALPAISGANLTALTAANLTGDLPAIDGSNLTGVATAAQGALGASALQPDGDGSGLTGVGASTTYGDVGTYGLFSSSSLASRAPATTLAGSGLYPANTYTNSSQTSSYTGSGSPSGTWRLMGQNGYYNGSSALARKDTVTSVWVRIS